MIVCHAGAGTIFTLLELGKKIIVAPNPKLKDDHQKDICRFVELNNYSFVAWNVIELKDLLLKIGRHSFNIYSNNNSEIARTIAEIIINEN